MQGTVLPKDRIAATRFTPKIILLYGLHKIGKTDEAAKLDDGLIMMTEAGAEMYDCMRINMMTTNEVFSVQKALRAAKEAAGPNKYAYKYGIIDTIDRLEDLAIQYCTWQYNLDPKRDRSKKEELYKQRPIEDRVDVITDLPHGRGHGYVRDMMLTWIRGFAGAFEHLILLGHVRDKEITTKEGLTAMSKDINLMGKLGILVCAEVDAIGYMYRNLKGDLRMNFNCKEANPTMGSRFKYLAGKDFPFSWETIYNPDAAPQIEESASPAEAQVALPTTK